MCTSIYLDHRGPGVFLEEICNPSKTNLVYDEPSISQLNQLLSYHQGK